MTRLLLARHGETAWNAERLIQGQSDDPLSERGREQSRRLAQRLANEPIQAIYTSDLARSAETAHIVAEGLAFSMAQSQSASSANPRAVPVYTLPSLREMDFGEWEGRTQAEVRRDYPELAALRRSDPLSFTPPGGEPFSGFIQRVQSTLDAILRKHPQDTVLVVSHGGPLCIILYTLLETTPIYPWRFRLNNASLSIVEVLTPQDGLPRPRVRAVLTLLNDTCHWSRD